MQSNNIHLSDQEILAFVDGELESRCESNVRSHLAACWMCRSRLSRTESTIKEFVEMHFSGPGTHTPPAAGPRALLKARLSEMSSKAQVSVWHRARKGLFRNWRLATSVAALFVLFVVGLRFNYLAPARSPAQAAGILPDKALTPGSVRAVTLADVCSLGRSDKNRAVTELIRRKVFREYGLAGARAMDYEVDYLITPELGGSDDMRNLWPQPYSPSAWNAYVKDDLEDRLHAMVCDGQIELSTAQHAIASDWIGAYKTYFHTQEPLAKHENRLAGQIRREHNWPVWLISTLQPLA